jgi:hypothetical protein
VVLCYAKVRGLIHHCATLLITKVASLYNLYCAIPRSTLAVNLFLYPRSNSDQRACLPNSYADSTRRPPTLGKSSRQLPKGQISNADTKVTQLESSLRNTLATFGRSSKQYLDIKYMVDEIATKVALEKMSISSSGGNGGDAKMAE